MIGDPLNDVACLGQLTAIARSGSTSAEIGTLAARFRTTRALAKWIRSLPQRDDTGRSNDGPRVKCDVGQRARLVADDPNCVERAILYLAAAEVIDPRPLRQLATVDINETLRHTFPLENGDPIVLDPQVRRNALRASVWQLRNGANEPGGDLAPINADALLSWLLDLAQEAAEEGAGDRGLERVENARRAIAVLLDGGRIHARDRAHVLFALRLGGEAASSFGAQGWEGYRLARRLIARLVAQRTIAAGGPRNLSAERIVYWGGKGVATFYGVGGLYDTAYAEVQARTNRRTQATRVNARPAAPASPKAMTSASVPAASAKETTAPPAMVLGTLTELETEKGT